MFWYEVHAVLRRGCLIVLGDSEFREFRQIVIVAIWPSFCRLLESRTCRVAEAR